MEQFASGWKRNYYGKGDVIVYRLNRDGRVPAGAQPGVRRQRADAALRRRVLAHLHDRRQHRPHRHRLDEELHPARDAELRRLRPGGRTAAFSARRFWRGIRRSRASRCRPTEIPYAGLPDGAGVHARRPRAGDGARRDRRAPGIVEAVSGLRGFKLLRLGGSAFHGFVRDEYTTLPDLTNRPLHMWLDLEWRYTDPAAGIQRRPRRRRARGRSCATCSTSFESGSIQQVIYQIGTAMLADIPRDRRSAPRSATTARGIRLPNAATRSASTPMRARRTAASA